VLSGASRRLLSTLAKFHPSAMQASALAYVDHCPVLHLSRCYPLHDEDTRVSFWKGYIILSGDHFMTKNDLHFISKAYYVIFLGMTVVACQMLSHDEQYWALQDNLTVVSCHFKVLTCNVCCALHAW
jgi:hypothetical protein